MDSDSQGTRKVKKKKKKQLDAVGKYYKSLLAEAKSEDAKDDGKHHHKKKKRYGILKGPESTASKASPRAKSDVFIGLDTEDRSSLEAGNLGKVHTPSDSSIKSTEILGIEILEPSKIIWIEKSRANIGVFKVVPFEFNVFDNSGERLLFVMPTIGSRENILGTAHRPNTFCIHTYMGRDLCDIKFNMGHCCRKSLKVEIRIDDETFAKVVQPDNTTDYLVYDSDQSALMQVALNKTSNTGGACGGAKVFEWNVYLAKELGHSVGTIGRNSATDVFVGEPLGFFFKERSLEKRKKKLQLDSQHKLIIVAILIGLSVLYYQH